MSSNDPTPDEPFGKLLQQYQRAVKNRDIDNASDAIHDIFALVEDWCEEHSSPDFELTIAAGEFEESADWGSAESTYNQILSLSDLEPATEYKAHSNLSSLYRLLGRNLEALGHSRCATAAARRADFFILLAMALQGETRCLIRCGGIGEAENTIAEAISAINDDTMCNQIRASLLTLRAECAIHNGAIAQADADLDEAFSFLESMAGMDIAAGIHGDLSHWWSVLAQLRSKYDDHDGAIVAWQKAVATAKHVASLPHADNVHTKAAVANLLRGLADALMLCGRPDDASAAFDERNAILYNIGMLKKDPE
jgi:tetratricopeptide (TPR) repeat protein